MEAPCDPRGAAPAYEDELGDDAGGDEKQKVSRWQIGSSSLGVLEQVYQMEPFPGAHGNHLLSAAVVLLARPARV